MQSILMQAISVPSGIQQFIPWIALLTFLGLAYMVFIKKDSKTIETLTTSKVLVPTFFLMALALVPSTVMAMFGIAEPIMTILVQLFVSFLVPLVMVAIPTYLVINFTDWLK